MKASEPKSIPFKNLNLNGIKIAFITSRFNSEITQALLQKAVDAFCECGGSKDQIDFFEVPGAFELPLTAKKVALTQKYSAILCLGAIIKGETAHFEYVASATIKGLNQVSLETEVPILSGVLTTLTVEQALDRLDLGRDYLISTLEMIETLQQIHPVK